MIPNVEKRVSDNLLQYLVWELQQARSDRSRLENDWIRYQEVYRARPKHAEKNFPFKGAANFVVPVAATDVDVTVSSLIGALFSVPNVWSCEGLRPDWLDFASKLEEFLEWAQEAELGIYDVVVDWITEMVKLGTGVLKQRYRREQRMMWEWREIAPNQTIQQMVKRMAVDRPDVSRVPLPNLYVPATTPDIQSSPWVTERLELTWTQLENRVRAGIYGNDFLIRIGAYWRQQQAPTSYQRYQSAQERLDHFLPSVKDRFEVFESWTTYDILATGEPVSVVCTFHEPTMSYGRIDFNPFFHQEKPYSSARFLRQEGRFYGIGLCEILEVGQEVVSTMECQRIDNGTIRNTTMLKTRRGSGIKQDEPIWPGRIFVMDNPETDLLPLEMGHPAEDTLGAEVNLINYLHQRSQVSDYQRGGAGNPAISYSTATTTVEMLKQGKLRLDQVLREVQKALGETGQRVVELYQQYAQGGKPYLVMGEKDGQIVNEVLHFPLDTIRMGVAIKVTATNSQVNRETKIRTDQIILGMTMQFYQQLFQAMTIVVNPMLPQPLKVLAGQMMIGGLTLARRILEAYGQKDIDQILPDLEQLGATVQQLEAINPSGAGGAGMGQGPGFPPGLAGLLPSGGGTNGNGVQGAPAGRRIA